MRPRIFAVLSVLVLLLTACVAPALTLPQGPPALSRTFVAMNAAKQELTENLITAGANVRGRVPDAPETAADLQALCDKTVGASRCALLDASRVVQAAAPGSQRAYTGATAHRWQAANATTLQCSQVYRAPEGYDVLDVGIDLNDGAALAVTLPLGQWLESQIAPVVAGLPVEIWIMQPDGQILYDANREEVGRNLFADPLYKPYPELLELGKRIAAEASGSGRYTFLRQDMQAPVDKTADWRTFDFCGQPWRVVMAHGGQVRDDGSALVAAPDLKAAQDALRAAAADPVLSEALATGDEAWGRTVFRSLYDAYPSIYAIQFLDKDGVNQYGYPPENSLVGYDFRSLQSQRDELFLEVLQLEHEDSFDQPLLEGPTGHFFFVPVYRDEEMLGMVYLIQTDRQ